MAGSPSITSAHLLDYQHQIGWGDKENMLQSVLEGGWEERSISFCRVSVTTLLNDA